MKTVKIMIKDTKKKAFTLIELLIVVAIIGILAGVGVPMYNGYMATAKIKSSETNHANTKSFIAATLTKCASGSKTVTMGSTSIECSKDTGAFKDAFVLYFNSINKNPHDGSKDAAVKSTSKTPGLGQTNIGNVGTTIVIMSNIGTEDGKVYYTKQSIINKE